MANLSETNLSAYLQSLAAKTSTPGGGAAAAVSAAQACALTAMVANFTNDNHATTIAERCSESIPRLLALADDDGDAFKDVMLAYKGKGNLQNALLSAAMVPVQVIELCALHHDDIDYLLSNGNQNLVTDTGIAALSFHASLQACIMNIRINLKSIKEAPDKTLLDALDLATNLSVQYLQVADEVNQSLTSTSRE